MIMVSMVYYDNANGIKEEAMNSFLTTRRALLFICGRKDTIDFQLCTKAHEFRIGENIVPD